MILRVGVKHDRRVNKLKNLQYQYQPWNTDSKWQHENPWIYTYSYLLWLQFDSDFRPAEKTWYSGFQKYPKPKPWDYLEKWLITTNPWVLLRTLPRVSIIFERTVFAPCESAVSNCGGLGFAIVKGCERKTWQPLGKTLLKVELLVGPTGKIPRSTLRGVQGIRRSTKMCQEMVPNINCPKWWSNESRGWIPWDRSRKKSPPKQTKVVERLFKGNLYGIHHKNHWSVPYGKGLTL